MDEHQQAQLVATLTNALTPAEIVKTVDGIQEFDPLKVYFDRAGEVALSAILLRAITAGRAHALAGRGEGIMKKLAEALGISERQAERYVRIDREIVRPRLARDGANAQFYLEEKAWFDIACEAAPVVQIPAVELLEQAEEKKAADPRFSASKWRKELGLGDSDEGSTGAPDKAIMRWLKRAAKFETGDGIEFAKNADREMLNVARDALTFAREILDAMEERFAGRIDA